jgi:cytochrome c-type biogenesis protein CcmH
MIARLVLALHLLVAAGSAVAQQTAAGALDDAAVQARLDHLAEELRCLVCQNQSLADSNADLAVDLRNRVREQIQAGKSDAEIRTWLTERYGDFVLYRPPFKASTVLLWVGPAAFLLGGIALLVLSVRRRRERLGETALTEEERARADALLRSDPPPSA